MEMKNFNVYFFFLALLGISVLTFFIFQPFFVAILLAAVLAMIFQNTFKFFLRITGNSQKISAFFTALLGSVIFGILFLGIVGLAVREISILYQAVAANPEAYHDKYIGNLANNISGNPLLRTLGANNLINSDTIGKSISDLSQGAFAILQKTYQGVANFLFMTLIMFFAMYYFLISGKEFVTKIMRLSPLRNSHEKILIEKFTSISSATIKGSLVIGIIQGVVGGTLFALVGIPSAAVWGIVMAFISLIPVVGTGLIWLPAGLFMIFIGNIWQGIVILAVGVGIISTIDNFLKPKLVGRNTEMHPLMILFAMLGGMNLLGFFGFIIGPIIVALFIALWDIYGVEFKGQLKKYNS